MRQTWEVGAALHLVSGTTLGRYELVLRVGEGGMGEVWAARLRREHGFQKIFALKVLKPELSGDPALQRMFLDEAEVAARIQHPNVVPVVDLGEDRGTLFLVMEWVCGEPLAAAIRGAAGRTAPPIVAARIAYQVCAGLEAAHELCDDEGRPLGLVHCDVSPENVLITSEGLVRLVDFGVAVYGGPSLSERGDAAAPDPDDEAPPPSRPSGELRGKVPYMAPEHIRGAPSDRRADLFAVGVLLYEMLSGSHPFLADDDQLTMCRIASEDPVAPLSTRSRRRIRISAPPPPPPVPPALERVVSAALAKSPSDRYPTAAEMMRALDEAVPGAALQSSDALVGQWLREVMGDALRVRAHKLREALEAVERGLVLQRAAARRAAAAPAGAPAPAAGEPPIVVGRAVERGEPAPASGRGALLRGARAGVAGAIAAAACAILGTAAFGDSPVSALEPDRGHASPPAAAGMIPHAVPPPPPAELPAPAEPRPERAPGHQRAVALDPVAPAAAEAAPAPRGSASPASRRVAPRRAAPTKRSEYTPRGL